MAPTSPFYINGIGIISPQKTYDNDDFLSSVNSYHKNILNCITPDFKSFINPAQLRRLGRMHRIGLASSMICLRDGDLKMPDGIITATGYGFLEETEKFLREIDERNEKQLTPTYFMQGTYNALAGLVALSLKCTGYNNTYVSKGFAFENALNDAMMQLSEKNDLQLLIGAFDEAAAVQYTAGLREGHYKKEQIESLKLFELNTSGTIQGEGASFFIVSGLHTASTWCKLSALDTVYRPDLPELSNSLLSFLDNARTPIDQIDLWIDGSSGDKDRDKLVSSLRHDLLSAIPQVRFKHLTGEYCTASSFAVWLGAAILKKQIIPEPAKVPDVVYPKAINTILIVNHYLGKNYSFFLLRRH